LDLPAAPLFKDALEKVIIPQVPVFDILRKFDGQTVSEDIKAGEAGTLVGQCVSRWPAFYITILPVVASAPA
jgi:hypothetical protein